MLRHLKVSRIHLIDETSDLLILMNLRGNKKLNLTVTYSVLQMGRLPIMSLKDQIYPKLVREFYSNALLHIGEPITISSALRGLDIMLNE